MKVIILLELKNSLCTEILVDFIASLAKFRAYQFLTLKLHPR